MPRFHYLVLIFAIIIRFPAIIKKMRPLFFRVTAPYKQDGAEGQN